MGSTSSSCKSTKYEDICDIDLENISKFENAHPLNITSNALWENKICIVLIVRRPGCIICREQASIIKELLEFNEDVDDVYFCAIVHENISMDVTEFQSYCAASEENFNVFRQRKEILCCTR